MKLEIRLINEKERALRDAELTIKLVFKGGKERILPTRTSNIRGEVQIDDVDAAVFKQINFAKSQYQIRVGDTQTPWLKLGRPHKVSAEHFRHVLIAKNLGARNDEVSTRSTAQLRAVLETDEGKRLYGAIAIAEFYSTSDERYQLEATTLDQDGVAEFELPIDGNRINWVTLKFRAKLGDEVFETYKNGNPDPSSSSDVWFIVSVMQLKHNTEPEVDPDGWSTGPSDSGWVVQGTVTGEGGLPQSGIKVKVFHKQIGSQVALGNATTASHGRYRIYYDASKVDGSPNLLVKTSKGNKVLATSGLIRKAGPNERVDFNLSADDFAGIPLYVQLLNDTEPFLDGKSPTTFDVEDVALLAEETNHNAIVLAHFVRAWDLIETLDSTDTDLAEPFFAFTVSGLQPTLDNILSSNNQKLRDLLTEAIESRWISKLDIEEVIEAIDALRTNFYQTADSDLSKLLDAAGVAAKKKGQVIAIVLGDGDGEEKWQKVTAVTSKPKSELLKGLVAIWRTLEKDATVTVYLHKQFKIANIESLVTLNQSQLEAAVKAGNEMSAEVPGNNNQQKIKHYVEALLKQIEVQHPHQHFLQNLAISEVDVAADRAQRMLTRSDIDLTKPESLRKLATNPSDHDLADLATLYLVCPSPQRAFNAIQLMDTNILSSMDVIARTKEVFRREMKSLLAEDIAEVIYKKSEHLGSVSTALSVAFTEPDPNKKNTLIGQLFSDAINDDCTHCRSTLSPSAYLLDLYRYLGRANFNNKTGIDLLNERRPDIEGLDLSCANANTLMPYIDLTLELLENMVAKQPLTSKQTTWEAEQLRAEPQFINAVAYDYLEIQTFPWALGYSRELDRSKSYLGHLGVDLGELSSAMSINMPHADAVNQRFSYTFNVINPSHIQLSNQPKWLANWGVNNRNQLENKPNTNGQKRSIADLSLWLHLTSEDLVALLMSDFVLNGADNVIVDSQLDWSKIENSMLSRLQFMGRLFKQTGYSVALLDRIFALDVVNEAVLNNWREELSAIQQLANRLKVSAEEIVYQWEENENNRREWLAATLGFSSVFFKKLETLSENQIAAPSTTCNFIALIQSIAQYEVDIVELVNVLDIAEDGHRFSLKTNVLLIEALIPVISEAPAASTETQLTQLITDYIANQYEINSQSVSVAFTQQTDLITSLLTLTQADEQVAKRVAKLGKLAWVVETLDLTEAGLAAVIALSQQHVDRWPNILSLPVDGDGNADTGLLGFIELAEYHRINGLYFAADKNIFTSLNDAASNRNALIAALGNVDGLWSVKNLTFLLGDNALNIDNKTAFFQKRGLTACSRILEAMSSTGGNVQQFWSAAAEHDASDAQDLLQSKLPQASYLKALQQLNDPIRETCQSRLVEDLLTQSRNKGTQIGFENKHELYAEILIDPEMSACFETSRIKQATASLQQLIQRILLNLELDGGFNEVDLQQWTWRKNYRVWEANRKVFITPENWVEPELRDNKTELFRDLETELLQGEVDEGRTEKALLNYARSLLSLSRMEMVATLHDTEGQKNHVFARTSDHPRKYYWCTRGNNGLWSGWESIEQEIEGDHILPVIYENRLFIFWLNLIEKVNTDHDGYKNRLAEIEASEEICRSEINELNRRIDDYKDKEEHYRQYNTGSYGGAGMAGIWNSIADQMATARVEAVALLEERKDDLISLKSQRDSLSILYSYFECNLSWSQYDHLNGWSPARRSVEAVNTIYQDDDGDDRHLRHKTSFWILAKPNSVDLDIELRANAANADGKTYHYRLGLFEFDPVLESISAKDEHQAPKLEYKMYFTTILQSGQRLNAIHPLPMLKIDVDNQDQTLLTWDRDIGARAYPEKISGYNPSHSPFLFAYQNRSYFFDPVGRAFAKPLIDIKATPKILPMTARETDSTANVNFQALSFGSGESTIQQSASPAFSSASLRKAATPLGKSNQKLADGRDSKQATLNAVPATANDWSGMQAVMQPNNVVSQSIAGGLGSVPKWNVSVLYHPFAEIIVSELYRGGLDGLYRPDAESGRLNAIYLKRQKHSNDVFVDAHAPSSSVILDQAKEERFEFNRVYPYSVYNWELFFHVPFTVAKQLTRNRQYEEAQRWLHFIFDPVSKDADTNRASWRFKPFFEEHARLLDGSQDELTEYAEENFAEFEAQVAEWEQNPFNPHAIARLRTISYMRATFIAYVDNLLAWADDLFRRDTMESISEAAQLYIHASQLVGAPPVAIPSQVFDLNSYTLAEMDEGEEQVHPLIVASGIDIPATEKPKNDFYSKMGLFCIPTNEKVKAYWDTIADRLFKIRHCMNIEGVERTLALYQPPIDPAMLVRAAAAGVDIGAVIAGMNAPRANYRFTYMLQKAKEFTNEVRSLGGALLAALEKKDSEELAKIRSGHELSMQKRILEIKKERLNEVKEGHASLEKALFSAMDRRDYYQDLLDNPVLESEKNQDRLDGLATALNFSAGVADMLGSALALIPDTTIKIPPEATFGGTHLNNIMRSVGSGHRASASVASFGSRLAGTLASRTRREQEWEFQTNQAKREIERLEKDQLASEIRIALAEKEIADQELQIANTEEADLYLRDKFTNQQLYGWMVSQLSSLHYQAYQLALDMAKQAEACLNFELESAPAAIIGFSYWDGMKKGLLSGERLSQDLNRLDAHYIVHNDRKLELSKNISLLRVDAGQLITLKQTSECAFAVPDYVFDLDYPDHINRRVKSIALTIPALAGPYTSLSCELSLEVDGSIVDTIALSSAQNDSGLFQFDMRDERYLPFEGQPLNGIWKLKLPPTSLAQFDYGSISDVILSINYTAKKDAARYADSVSALESVDFGHERFEQLLSMKTHFSDVWHMLISHGDGDDLDPVTLKVFSHYFPYIAAARGVTLQSYAFITHSKDGIFNSVEEGINLDNVSLDNDWVGIELDNENTVLQEAQNYKDIYIKLGYSVKRSS